LLGCIFRTILKYINDITVDYSKPSSTKGKERLSSTCASAPSSLKMVAIYENPYCGTGLPAQAPGKDVNANVDVDGIHWQHLRPELSAKRVQALLAHCPVAHETPLVAARTLATEVGIAELYVKDERSRMGLGSFKALGAAFAIAVDAVEAEPGCLGNETIKGRVQATTAAASALKGRVYVAASAGNHGLSVAAGAKLFGARAVIYLAETVPDAFADQLTAYGATVVRSGSIYEESMAAAKTAAETNGSSWTLLSDSSWPGYIDTPMKVMEGYLQLAEEVTRQWPLRTPTCGAYPSHIFLQAGVGGMAVALAGYFRSVWGNEPKIIVVEPEAAPALIESIKAGRSVITQGPASNMGRLDCKEPSLIALAGLADYASHFITVSEIEVENQLAGFAAQDLQTSPSGGAGLAALFALSKTERASLGINKDSRILTVVSEADPA
jgi:diaminopropionate ammonia-lyase